MNEGADTADAVARPNIAGALTVAAARRMWAARFRVRNIDTPELDARLLVGHALRLDHAALAAADRRLLSTEEIGAIAALADRRLAHEPVARILGSKEFWSLPLRINAATLVPRPESETVVEAALGALDARGPRSRALRIADLGTGSGALLLALLTELENAVGVGSDLNVAALDVARDNARRLGLTRARFVACDMAAALSGPFDLIVSNPPYIASGDIAALAAEVREFEPRLALDGGGDGLAFYRAIAATTPALLAPDGTLVVELGSGQAQRVGALFAAAGLASRAPRPDLAGIARALVATRGHERGALDPGKKALGMSAGTD
jgi:release factor glutamine methyltransferase